MHRIRSITSLLAVLLSAAPVWTQEQSPKSNLVSELSAEVASSTDEPRDQAQHELFVDYASYEAPDIASPLSDPLSFIAIVTLTGVKFPEQGSIPYPLVRLHVDQFLRGVSEQTELQAESRWRPPRTQQNDGFNIDFGSPRGTAFDYTEPKVGNRFLIGYPFLDVERGSAHIFGAIDLSDHDQALIVPDVQRFLGIEFAAGNSNFAPFVEALNGPVPWIRDLSASRLVQSEACDSSSACREALLNFARRLLQSKKLADRWEALQWMQPLAQPTGERMSGSNGLPLMSSSAARELFVSALSDSNLWIADEAFRELEMFDFFQMAHPDECIVIFPTLRESVRLSAHELKGLSISGSVACTPAQADSDSR
ncbi:MAG TPA: hypothetical protein VIH76_20100 [Candidatus Acidoferrales bacterium]